jgi:hypothetical protein
MQKCNKEKSIPKNVRPNTRLLQLAVYVIFPDAGCYRLQYCFDNCMLDTELIVLPAISANQNI